MPRSDAAALYAKLSAAHPDVAEVARAVADAGADGLSLINTLRGLALDPRTLKPVLARGTGGLSGPSLKPIALATVHACHAATRLPIVGMGGITTAQDVVEFIACGAQHVALGTVLFSDPDAPETHSRRARCCPRSTTSRCRKALEFRATPSLDRRSTRW